MEGFIRFVRAAACLAVWYWAGEARGDTGASAGWSAQAWVWVLVGGVLLVGAAFGLGMALCCSRRALRDARSGREEAQARLDQLTSSVDHIFWIRETRSSRYLYIGEAFERLWGIGKQELERDPEAWKRLIHDDDRPGVEGALSECLAGKRESFRAEYRIRRDDGEMRWICAEGRTIRDASGRAYRVSGVARDVTDRVTAEQQLRESEERLELALWGSGLGLWDWEVQAGRVFYNVQWANILGYHQDEIQPNIQAMLALTHPDEASSVLAGLQAHLDGRTAFFEAEHRMLGRDEGWRWVINRAKVVTRDDEGRAVRVVGTIKDIDTEKRNEQRATGLGRVLEESLNEIYIFDAVTFEYIQANRGARASSGYEESELAGLTPMDLYPSFTAHTWREVLGPLLEERRAQTHFTTRRRRKDGSLHPVELYVQTAVFEGRMASVVIAMDIAERCEAERRLRESEQQFRLAFQAAAAGMALTTPEGELLRVNRAFAEMLGYEAGELEGRCVREITHPHDRALSERLIRDLAEGTIPSIACEKRYLRRDGHVVWGSVWATMARAADGKPAYFVVQVRDVTKRREAEHALKRRQAEAARFKTRLTRLIDVSNTLGEVESLEAFCRGVIELGRSHLKFDRLGLWLLDQDKRTLTGTFGVDEHGRIRDERHSRLAVSEIIGDLNPREAYGLSRDNALYNHEGQVIGRGTRLWSAIWRGERLVGYLSCDNLLHRQPLREKDGELLAVYATTIGHLLSRKRTEQVLRENEHRYRRMAEARRRLLEEVNHRVRNNLNCLLSLLEHAAPNAAAAEFAAAMEQRIRAITHTHNVLSGAGWQDIDLAQLLRAVIGSMQRMGSAGASVDLDGPSVQVAPEKVMPLAMTIVEWQLNSSKYGAHSVAQGKVRIRWQTLGENGDTRLVLRWTETGGPPITAPPGRGSGMSLVEGFIRYDLGGECRWGYPPTGADHEIAFSVHCPASATGGVETGGEAEPVVCVDGTAALTR